MIRYRKVKKKDLPMLIEYKLLTIIPYVNDNEEKLKIINYVNNYMKDKYLNSYFIVYNFKVIGAFLIDNDELDMLYIIPKYHNRGIGGKVLNKYKGEIKKIKVRSNNKWGLEFYLKNEFRKIKEENDIIYLERVEV